MAPPVPPGEPGDRVYFAAAFEGLHKLDYGLFALAPHQVIGVIEGFVRHEGRMKASHHNRNAGGPHPVGDLIGPGSRVGYGGDADEVRCEELLVGRLHEVFDEDLYLVALVSQDGADENGPQARNDDPIVDMVAESAGLYKDYALHDSPRNCVGVCLV